MLLLRPRHLPQQCDNTIHRCSSCYRVRATGRQGFSIHRKRNLHQTSSQLLNYYSNHAANVGLWNSWQLRKGMIRKRRAASAVVPNPCSKRRKNLFVCLFICWPERWITKTIWTKVNPSGPLLDRRLNTEAKCLPKYVPVVVPFVLSFRNNFRTATEVCKPRGSANGHLRASSGVEESMRTARRKYLTHPTNDIWRVRQK